VRLFIAVDCGERFRRLLSTQLDAWRAQVNIAWSRPQNWHVTLDFLGEVPPARVPDLRTALLEESPAHAAFSVLPGQLGAFPDLRAPRVLFLHMDSGGALERLAAGVRRRVDAVLPAGEQDRRKPFRAHLTVARIKRPLKASQTRMLGEIALAPWEPLPVRDFRLVESELRPDGPRYTDLAVFPLARDR
jgi:2'-5' RNA ligase